MVVAVAFAAVTKRFGDVDALRPFTLDVDDGTVVTAEGLGPRTVAGIDIGGMIVRWGAAPVGVRVGQRLAVSLDPTRFHVFDARTGVAMVHPE